MTRLISSLVVEEPFRVDIRSERTQIRTTDVIVRTTLSGISVGTELAIITGMHPAHTRGYDWRRGLFGAVGPRASYPVAKLGYMQTGVVSQAGNSDLPVGARVAMSSGHCTAHVTHQSIGLIPLPDDLPDEAGVFVSTLGPVAANALLHAAVVESGRNGPTLRSGVEGKRVIVFGGGAVGLLVAVFAQTHGARTVIVVERDPWRRSVANSLGMDTFDDSRHEAGVHFRTLWALDPIIPGGGDIAFQTRPTSEGVAAALRSVQPGGVVIDLAFHTGPAAGLFLGEEFHHGSQWLVAAQVDRVPRGTETQWTRRRLAEETIRVLMERPDTAAALVTDRVPFSESPRYLTQLVSAPRSQLTPVLTF